LADLPAAWLTSDKRCGIQLSPSARSLDYFWHITLPVIASTISSFATLTLLTKNSFLDEIRKQYVMTARAKGLMESRMLYGHVFRNAMLIVIAGFPAVFVGCSLAAR
jgi:microcin C transport system permease protein